MSNFNISDQGGLRTIRFDRGTANAIDESFLTELRELYRESLSDDGVLGIHLSGKEHFFSAGLDIVRLYEYNAAEFERFWELFMHCIYEMSAFDKPVVAAITGHAPAGGCILAMSADYRFMASGNYKIGLNEIPVGIIVPPSIYQLYAFWIGSRHAYQYLQEGKLHTVEEAHAIHLVDEVVPFAEVDEKALAQLEKYTDFHQGAWRNTKKNCRKELLHHLEVRRDVHFEQSVEQWWKPEIREMMQGFIDRLQKKQAG